MGPPDHRPDPAIGADETDTKRALERPPGSRSHRARSARCLDPIRAGWWDSVGGNELNDNGQVQEEQLVGGVANAGAVVRVGEHVLRPVERTHRGEPRLLVRYPRRRLRGGVVASRV